MSDLTLAAAQTILATALETARAHRLKPLAVVVYDARGALKALGAEDGTSLRRAEVAMGKANGCLALGLGGGRSTSAPRSRPISSPPSAISPVPPPWCRCRAVSSSARVWR